MEKVSHMHHLYHRDGKHLQPTELRQPCRFLKGGLPGSSYKWGYFHPMNGLVNGGYNPTYRSHNLQPQFRTGSGGPTL